jgi:hypothetical protein
MLSLAIAPSADTSGPGVVVAAEFLRQFLMVSPFADVVAAVVTMVRNPRIALVSLNSQLSTMKSLPAALTEKQVAIERKFPMNKQLPHFTFAALTTMVAVFAVVNVKVGLSDPSPSPIMVTPATSQVIADAAVSVSV